MSVTTTHRLLFLPEVKCLSSFRMDDAMKSGPGVYVSCRMRRGFSNLVNQTCFKLPSLLFDDQKPARLLALAWKPDKFPCPQLICDGKLVWNLSVRNCLQDRSARPIRRVTQSYVTYVSVVVLTLFAAQRLWLVED